MADVRVEPPGPIDLSDDIPFELDDLAELDEGPAPVLDVDQVRRFLAGLGSALGFAIGDPDVAGHWQFTPDELDDLAAPLTALANRRPELARAIHRSDHLLVAMTLARWTGRNVAAGRRARKAREDIADAEHGEVGAAGQRSGWNPAGSEGP